MEFAKRFTVVLSRPENPENIGLVARNMKNTGFTNLRIVGIEAITPKAYSVAVHAKEILDRTRFFNTICQATADLNIVFAATSKRRKNVILLPLKGAISRMIRFPPDVKIGLLFGCERTGLSSEELKSANFAYVIPQASRQPSYNLSSAVLVTLFSLFPHTMARKHESPAHQPLPRKEQEECIRRILERLEKKKFIHRTNKLHMTERICDLFGRLQMSERDRELLLALFSKGIEARP